METFAEVEVITDPESIERQERSDHIDEVDIDAESMPPGLDDLKARRDTQRNHPHFGALADRNIVYISRRWDGKDDLDPTLYLMEIGADGRRLRQVELAQDGTAIKSDPDDWIFNTPMADLFDPELVDLEISREEFEAAWLHARREENTDEAE